VAEPQQRWRALRRWRDLWPGWLLWAAVLVGLAVLAVMVWSRWELAGLAVACGIALVGGLIVWAVVMPGRLAPPLRGRDLARLPDAKARLEAIDARTRLHHDLRNGALQLLTVLAVLVGAGLGFQQLAEDRDQASEDRRLTRQGQASERFTRAIDQLGSSRVETRIGGTYGLDQIAEQAPENTGPVAEVLLAWLNGRPRPRAPLVTQIAQLRERAPDVQAALSVLARPRYSPIVAGRLNLHGQGLRGADLREADLLGADLSGADLSHSDLSGADLSRANLFHADLTGAKLFHADLFGANLRGADLTAANLQGADLSRATLEGAKLKYAAADGTTRWPAGFDWRRSGAEIAPP
jgi:hypothetical protein